MLKRWIFILFMFMGLHAFSQVTPNIGFDDGTFNHWQCWTGSVRDGLQLAPSNPVETRHTLMSNKNILDDFGDFPVVSPNGSKYSIRLGNQGIGAEAERVSYTLTVPASGDYTIIFNYAVVLQNPDHAPNAQPRFTAKVFDETDNVYLDCPSFDFIASPRLPGFILSTKWPGEGEVYYKPWSKATIDLHGYPNKTIRIEFTTMDCVPGAHFGYAYLDIEDNDLKTPITGNAYCNNQQSITLTAPVGFASYTWFNADKSTVLGQGRILTTPAPPDNTPVIVHIEPFDGLGCPEDLVTVVNKINADFELKVNDQKICPGALFNLTSAAATAGSIAVKYLSYFNDIAGTQEVSNPQAVNPGTYYIKGLSQDGCSDIKAITVSVYDVTDLTVTNPPAVTYPEGVDLSATFSQQPGYQYVYLSSPQSNTPITNYAHINRSGTYYIKAISPGGCETIKPVKVTVNAPPAMILTTPNTFTPNGDGINDQFLFSATGFYTFVSLNIYNRNGGLVFSAKKPDAAWDGTYHGKSLPTGVYYWVFEGIDDYSQKKVRHGGSITIVR